MSNTDKNTKKRTSFPLNLFKRDSKRESNKHVSNNDSSKATSTMTKSFSESNGQFELKNDNTSQYGLHSNYDIQSILNDSNLPSYPMIILKPDSGFACEGLAIDDTYSNTRDQDLPFEYIKSDHVENINDQNIYEKHFACKEHYNYIGVTTLNEDFSVSIKFEHGIEHINLRYVLRLRDGNNYGNLKFEDLKDISIINILEQIERNLKIQIINSVQHPEISQLILDYDRSLRKNTFTFALIYQTFGQTTEKEIYNNKTHGKNFEEFLEFFGRKIKLKNFNGFRGGLDVLSDCTGEYSIYEKYEDSEIMFHVSTLLPHSDKNDQQLERKRHIGNDRVAIVFQEENTPFSPCMINSKLIQVYIVVQPVKDEMDNSLKRYKISIVSRNGAPYFGPYLCKPYVFVKDDNLKRFLYAKLINAEYASLKLFHSFNEQTIKPTLTRLCDRLTSLSDKFNSSTPLKQTPLKSPVERIKSKFGFSRHKIDAHEELARNEDKQTQNSHVLCSTSSTELTPKAPARHLNSHISQSNDAIGSDKLSENVSNLNDKIKNP